MLYVAIARVAKGMLLKMKIERSFIVWFGVDFSYHSCQEINDFEGVLVRANKQLILIGVIFRL